MLQDCGGLSKDLVQHDSKLLRSRLFKTNNGAKALSWLNTRSFTVLQGPSEHVEITKYRPHNLPYRAVCNFTRSKTSKLCRLSKAESHEVDATWFMPGGNSMPAGNSTYYEDGYLVEVKGQRLQIMHCTRDELTLRTDQNGPAQSHPGNPRQPNQLFARLAIA